MLSLFHVNFPLSPTTRLVSVPPPWGLNDATSAQPRWKRRISSGVGVASKFVCHFVGYQYHTPAYNVLRSISRSQGRVLLCQFIRTYILYLNTNADPPCVVEGMSKEALENGSQSRLRTPDSTGSGRHRRPRRKGADEESHSLDQRLVSCDNRMFSSCSGSCEPSMGSPRDAHVCILQGIWHVADSNSTRSLVISVQQTDLNEDARLFKVGTLRFHQLTNLMYSK